jgi:hypothetical protein
MISGYHILSEVVRSIGLNLKKFSIPKKRRKKGIRGKME